MAKQRIVFQKDGPARYISHLDLMRTMQRAFMRADIKIYHTEGFHPHPYISMPLPLPLFFSSECEVLEFGLEGGAAIEEVPARLSAALPEGIRVTDCYDEGIAFRHLCFVRYRIDLEFERDIAATAETALRELLAREAHVITKRSKKAKSGQTELDIIPMIEELEKTYVQSNQLSLQILLRAQNPGLNPDLLLGAFRSEFPDLAPSFARFHRLAILDEQKQPYR